jgi:hypothetical protein
LLAASRPCSPPPLECPYRHADRAYGFLRFVSWRHSHEHLRCMSAALLHAPFRASHTKSCDSKVPRWVRCNHAEGEFHACAQPMRTRDWCFCVYLDVDTSGQGFEWPALNSAMDWCDQMLSDGVRPKFQLSKFYNAGGQWSVHRTRMQIC